MCTCTCKVAAYVFLLPPLEIPRPTLSSKQHWPQKNLSVTNRNAQITCAAALHACVCLCTCVRTSNSNIPMSKAVSLDGTDGEKGQILHLEVIKNLPQPLKSTLNQRTWFLFHSVCSPGSSRTLGLRGPKGKQKHRHRESSFLAKTCDNHNEPTSPPAQLLRPFLLLSAFLIPSRQV